MRALLALSAVLGACLLGCGVDHEDLCERLAEDCPSDFEISDCVQDGQSVDDAANSGGCNDQLTSYLECLDQDVCTWDLRCTTERAALESCSGSFPTH